ncbi:MAG: hypothetical protein IPM13_17610 [Phycisphaerales bacterium]|nr:hypothetical protein [Phycisphaerales bacterium]
MTSPATSAASDAAATFLQRVPWQVWVVVLLLNGASSAKNVILPLAGYNQSAERQLQALVASDSLKAQQIRDLSIAVRATALGQLYITEAICADSSAARRSAMTYEELECDTVRARRRALIQSSPVQ